LSEWADCDIAKPQINVNQKIF